MRRAAGASLRDTAVVSRHVVSIHVDADRSFSSIEKAFDVAIRPLEQFRQIRKTRRLLQRVATYVREKY